MGDSRHRRTFRSALMVLAVVLLPTPASATDPASARFEEVVLGHLARYPEMELVDLYKLVYQAAMGAEHAVPSRQAAAGWLEREMAGLAEMSSAPLTEPLRADGSLVRVNLRPFAEQGGDRDRLLDAFVRTAEEFSASEKKLRDYWSRVEDLAEQRQIPFTPTETRQWLQTMESRGYPPVRHSETYREIYRPAYRVVLLEYLHPPAEPTTAR